MEPIRTSTPKQPNLVVRFLTVLWRLVDQTRRFTMNMLFVSFLLLVPLTIFLTLLLMAGMSTTGVASVQKGSALLINPQGSIVEQRTANPLGLDPLSLLSTGPTEALLSDILDAIELAKEDDDIAAIVLDLRKMGGTGLSKLIEIGAALDDFSQSEKQILCYADFYSQGTYLLAAHADKIHMEPMGGVEVFGLASYRTYFKEALDKLSVDYNVFRVGEYKSALEPYLRNDMSEEDRQATLEWLGELWTAYREDLLAARPLDPMHFDHYVENYPELLESTAGDSAAAALEVGLVDELIGWRSLEDKLIKELGKGRSDSFKRVDFDDYMALKKPFGRTAPLSRDGVGLVIARGTILPGEHMPGTIGGDSTAELLEAAREDDRVKAVVLRIDSGGGAATASEVIRREIDALRAAGKPVVASMSSVAASGGYWIAMSADRILAAPTTLTGSIGIFAGFPTVERSLAKVGVHSDGVKTGPLAGGLMLDRSVTEEQARTLQLGLNHGYADFVGKVAEARGIAVEQVDKIARGRVWTGSAALERGLIDGLGSLDEAIREAAKLADLDDPKVRLIERDKTWQELLLESFQQSALVRSLRQNVARPSITPGASPWGFLAARSRILTDLDLLFSFEPNRLYAYCFCSADA